MPKLQPSDWKRNVPAGMKALGQWVGWSTTEGRKVPKNLTTGRSAKANDPATWGKYDDAARWYERHQKDPNRGCGFVFRKGDGLVFVDVDNCLTDDGKLNEWAEPIIRPFIGRCYAEKSPGGRGLHLFLIANFPAGTTKTGATWKVFPEQKDRRDNIAVFDDRRFSTVTGDVFEGSRTLAPNQSELDALLARTGLSAKLTGAGDDATTAPQGEEISEQTIADVKRALEATDADLPYDQWLKVGMALRSLGDVGFKIWDEWSRKGKSYKSGETRAKWAGFKPEGVGIGSVFFVAEDESGFTLRTSAEDDFASFKGVGDDKPEERYERGSLVKWRELGLHLVATGKGQNITVKPSEGDVNVGLYFENHERWKGQLRFNVRTAEVEALDGEPIDLHQMARHVQFFMGWGRSPSEESVLRAVSAVSRLNSYDPVAEWLKGLKWDQGSRIAALPALLGLEDDEMTRRHLKRWMIGAVARAFIPGCRFQTMLVIHGAQGKKKSEFFSRLAVRPEWYSESQVDMTNKEGQLALLGPWIVENAELDGMTRADVTRVKVFISEAVSRFRKPYGRKTESHPRRCALGGTTNEVEFLRDPTGSRRFHLIGVKPDVELKVELLDEKMVAQLWAEATALFLRKERWWDEGDEVRAVLAANEEHYEGTALDGYVQAVLVELKSRAVTTVQEVTLRLADKFRLPHSLRQRDVAASMARAGWTLTRLRAAGSQRRFWHSATAQPEFLEKAAEQALARIEQGEFSEEDTK